MTKTNIPKVVPLFPETKKVLASFNVELENLQVERETLEGEIESITTKIAELMTSVESSNLSDRIQLNIDIKQLKEKSKVIQKMLEENDVAVEQCHLKHAKHLRTVRSTEYELRKQYDLNEIVDRHIKAMLTEINGIGKQFKNQHSEVVSDLYKIYSNPTVKHHFPRSSDLWSYEHYQLKYWTSFPNVLTRNDIDSAAYGGEMK